jgi:peptide/nickel transport system substrate-binding protein
MRNKLFTIAALLIVASMVLGACATQPATPAAPGVTEVVVTVEVGGETKVVTATPEPAGPPPEFTSKDPNTFVMTTIGEPETFDPALAYDTASGEIIQNVYDTLVFYNREKAAEFIPQLASAWTISEDGKTYTFDVRKGVKFHTGNEMTVNDVAFSFWRGLLQGGTASPQWMYYEPFFGIGVDDISVVVEQAVAGGAESIADGVSPDEMGALEGALYDDTEAVKAVDPAALVAVCEKVKSLVVADEAAGTVTMNLAIPWGPMIPTLAQTWGSVMEQKWVADNGGWDGSCDSWQNFYAITSENNVLTPLASGTGPFKFDSWTRGEEIVLTRNDDYWRTEPMWEGGPSGPAALERVVIKSVDEWGTRFAMLQAGDTDMAVVARENTSQVIPFVGEECPYNFDTNDFDACVPTAAPDQPLRLFIGAPQITRTDVFFNFDIKVEGGNPFVGSGVLDGNGIPPNFFADEHVRKAFNYCFDWDVFIQDALVGEGVQAVGIPIPGMPGYEVDGPKYTFDAAKCEEEFKASTLTSPDGASLWDTGFRMQVAYNTGNSTRQIIAEIMASNLSAINELFQIEIIGLPWPTFLRAQRAQTLPLFVTGWQEDIHDPHNWYVPYLTGTYGRRQSLPADITAQVSEIINAGVAEADPAKRAEIYKELNQVVYDLAPQILLAIPTGRHYEQRWVQGWYFNPLYPGWYYYSLSKK